MALYEIEKNSSGVPTGNYKYVAGRVNSEKINEMYEAFPSDASASNKLATQNDALPSEPINGVITITAVTGATATATTNYTRLRTGDLVNVVINSDVVFSESWWGTVSGLSALGITNIQSLFAVRGSRRIQARVCYNGTKYLDFISDAVIPSTASASNKLVTESELGEFTNLGNFSSFNDAGSAIYTDVMNNVPYSQLYCFNVTNYGYLFGRVYHIGREAHGMFNVQENGHSIARIYSWSKWHSDAVNQYWGYATLTTA